MTRPLVIAHRGASGERPENTLSAFERAVEQAADMIETDLHLSRDGVVVIHHDPELERLGLESEIRDHTASELAGLNAAPGAQVEEQIPMLLDILDGFATGVQQLRGGVEDPLDGGYRTFLARLAPGFEIAVVSRVRQALRFPGPFSRIQV